MIDIVLIVASAGVTAMAGALGWLQSAWVAGAVVASALLLGVTVVGVALAGGRAR